MSSSEAQKSPVHHATDDSTAEPNGPDKVSPEEPAARNGQPGAQASRDDTTVGKDPDESTYGGPLKIDDASAESACFE